MSCPERAASLRCTLLSLKAGGWPELPEVVMDHQHGPTSMARLNLTWRCMIQVAGQARSDFVLLCEDDLVFGRWFADNLISWPVMLQASGGHFWGSLYNHGQGLLRRVSERHSVADPAYVWGSQAVVVTPRTAQFLDLNWDKGQGNADVRMPQLASAVSPLCYHCPSLVDHTAQPSTWGAEPHRAVDFDPDWHADPDWSA